MSVSLGHSKYLEIVALLAMQLTPGMGYKRINRLVHCMTQHGAGPASLLNCDYAASYLSLPGLDPAVAAMLTGCDETVRKQAADCIRDALRKDILPVSVLDPAYPMSFRRSLGDAAPPLVFTRGNIHLLQRCSGAVVGTRAPSSRGIAAARNAAEQIGAHTGVVTSGGAFGVDWAAHNAALETGANTVVMLPQGILSYHLPEVWRNAYDEGRIVLLCESMPDAPWQTHAAVARNALISANAQLVCVIEPRKQGGSIMTLRHALKQRKPVLAAPVAALAPELRAQVAPLSRLRQQITTMDWETIRHQHSTGTQDDLL